MYLVINHRPFKELESDFLFMRVTAVTGGLGFRLIGLIGLIRLIRLIGLIGGRGRAGGFLRFPMISCAYVCFPISFQWFSFFLFLSFTFLCFPERSEYTRSK